MAGHEAGEGLMVLDGEFAAATPALMARAAEYQAMLDAALDFTKPSSTRACAQATRICRGWWTVGGEPGLESKPRRLVSPDSVVRYLLSSQCLHGIDSDARQAGTKQASAATARSVTATAAKMAGSSGRVS